MYLMLLVHPLTCDKPDFPDIAKCPPVGRTVQLRTTTPNHASSTRTALPPTKGMKTGSWEDEKVLGIITAGGPQKRATVHTQMESILVALNFHSRMEQLGEEMSKTRRRSDNGREIKKRPPTKRSRILLTAIIPSLHLASPEKGFSLCQGVFLCLIKMWQTSTVASQNLRNCLRSLRCRRVQM